MLECADIRRPEELVHFGQQLAVGVAREHPSHGVLGGPSELRLRRRRRRRRRLRLHALRVSPRDDPRGEVALVHRIFVPRARARLAALPPLLRFFVCRLRVWGRGEREADGC
jgi:hypothetical protein